MRAYVLRLVVLVLFVPAVALALLVSDQPPPGLLPHLPPPKRPATVTLGDSTLSGEGSGSYDPGTRGENGDWCHRSATAPLDHLDLPGNALRVNLACSGAKAEAVGLNPPPGDAEVSQARQLADIARRYRVTNVIVQIGANDDPSFVDTVNECVRAWAARIPAGCAKQLQAAWPQRLSAMKPKVLAALQDVRTVMAQAGYAPRSYSLVVQSYAAPVGPDVAPELQNLSGCPFLTSDLGWLRADAVPQLSQALREVADQVGARFLDFSRAGNGHEACSGGNATPQREWFTRLTVNWDDLRDDARAAHAMQESFHANAAGQAASARCMSEFLAGNLPSAVCLAGPDGALHALPDRLAAAQGPPS